MGSTAQTKKKCKKKNKNGETEKERGNVDGMAGRNGEKK